MFVTIPSLSFRFCPVAPVFARTVSNPTSTSLNAAIAAAPTPTIGAVTFLDMLAPTSLMPDPRSFTLSPATCICCLKTDPKSLACFSKYLRLFVVSAISLSRACICCLFSSDGSAFFNCSYASFVSFNLSFVAAIDVFKRSCFCFNRVTLPGSIFNNRLTSFKDDCVSFKVEFAFFNASDNFVVFPSISIVIPLILSAIFSS